MAAITLNMIGKAAAVLALTGLVRFFYLLYKRRMNARAISDQYGLVRLISAPNMGSLD